MVPEHVVKSHWFNEAVTTLSTRNIPGSLTVDMGLVRRRDKAKGPVIHWLYDATMSMMS
ncbi:LysR family transcriptional regulator, partial [Pseudoalteromonas maricaloris]